MSDTVPAMRAFVRTDRNNSDFEMRAIAIPQLGEGELLVKMQAVGVGVHDAYFLPPATAHPYPIGIEGAGVVEQVGGAFTRYRPGDRIAFISSMQRKGGTWAEYAIVAEDALILPLPVDLDFVRAAALPVAGNTALRALAPLDDLTAGSSVFVAGGAGAIGTLVIQLARLRGLRVAASASPRNHAYLRSLGADVAVDYRDAHWPDHLRRWRPKGVDAALAVHPGTSADTLRAVANGGRLITISGDTVVSERGVKTGMIDYGANIRQQLLDLLAGVTAGAIHLEVERVYQLECAAEALARVQTRHVRGKLVLSL